MFGFLLSRLWAAVVGFEHNLLDVAFVSSCINWQTSLWRAAPTSRERGARIQPRLLADGGSSVSAPTKSRDELSGLEHNQRPFGELCKPVSVKWRKRKMDAAACPSPDNSCFCHS